MKPPKPTEGVARHCWGKRRRAAKKIEKGIWKAMDRLGILAKTEEDADSCSWDEEYSWRGGRRACRRTPFIGGWTSDYWGECDVYPISVCGKNFLETKFRVWEYVDEETGWPKKRAYRDDRHALQLLRQEIRDRKRRTQAPGQRGEG